MLGVVDLLQRALKPFEPRGEGTDAVEELAELAVELVDAVVGVGGGFFHASDALAVGVVGSGSVGGVPVGHDRSFARRYARAKRGARPMSMSCEHQTEGSHGGAGGRGRRRRRAAAWPIAAAAGAMVLPGASVVSAGEPMISLDLRQSAPAGASTGAPPATPGETTATAGAGRATPSTSLSLEPGAPATSAKAGQAAAPSRPQFGLKGSRWLTFTAGVAHNLSKDTDYNVAGAWSTFLAQDLEFVLELGGWYFAQAGKDTGGINGSMVLRYHLLHDEARDWTVFADAGIGLLGAFDRVPATGTEFNFTPRVGGGATFRIDDDGTRLIVGARWHHISNARIQGDSRNPSRDSIMVYAGVVVPF